MTQMTQGDVVQNDRDVEKNRLHAILNKWATAVARKRGVIEVPPGYEAVVKPFSPIAYDGWGGLPVFWGFEIVRHTSNATGKMYESAKMEAIGRSGYGAVTWGFVLVRLSHTAAERLIGKQLSEERGPRGGFRSVTFGPDDQHRDLRRFCSKDLDFERETGQQLSDAFVEF